MWLAWLAMIVVVALIIVGMFTRMIGSVWQYSALFLAFMTAFCHLMALMLRRMSGSASKKLEIIAMIFGILTVAAIITLYVLDW